MCFSYICWNTKYFQKSPDLSLELCIICVGRVSSRHRRRPHGQSATSLSVAPRGRWQSWSRKVWYHLSAIFWIARTHRWSVLFWMASTTCWRWQVIRSINWQPWLRSVEVILCDINTYLPSFPFSLCCLFLMLCDRHLCGGHTVWTKHVVVWQVHEHVILQSCVVPSWYLKTVFLNICGAFKF